MDCLSHRCSILHRRRTPFPVDAKTIAPPILQPSTLRISDAPHDVRVEDLSPNGFAFSSTVPIPIDTIVHVGLAGAGRATARIVRRADTVYGCIFEPGLTSAQIEDAFTRSPSDTVTTLAAGISDCRRWRDIAAATSVRDSNSTISARQLDGLACVRNRSSQPAFLLASMRSTSFRRREPNL
ncbi:PilZ domain-containing protein [Sphingomonas sp. H160509]|uniref:PilZ domain-containing protein n=1 Tax=Sphingomonas sp. H160509 TaxID=2955313 RepID=UPI00406C2596